MVTKSDIESYFNGTVVLDNTFADNIIKYNTQYASQLAGVPFGVNSETEYLNVYETTDRVQTLHAPIISIVSLFINKGDEFSPNYVQTTDFVIEDKDIGLIKLKEPVTPGVNKIKIVYNYGIDPIPFHVEKLILDLCVLDVLKLLANQKAGNDDADNLDLGAIKLQGSYSALFTNLSQLRQEINEITKNLYMSNAKYRLWVWKQHWTGLLTFMVKT